LFTPLLTEGKIWSPENAFKATKAAQAVKASGMKIELEARESEGDERRKQQKHPARIMKLAAHASSNKSCLW